MKIEVISGSPRIHSATYRVALHLKNRLARDTEHEVDLIDLRHFHLPPMEDVWKTAADAPESHRAVAERIFAADGFIMVTPEYNGSYSPAMQNLFDHFPKQMHKAFGLVTASPGALGGMRAAMQLQQFVLALFGVPSPVMLVTPGVDKKFDEEGNLVDTGFARSVDHFVQEYLWLAERLVETPVPAVA